NAPSPRASHSAVWTGNRMVVWGGRDTGFTPLGSGGRYDPVTDTWTATSTRDAPFPRLGAQAVWTGQAMIVWGGAANASTNYVSLNTGGRYDPDSDSWRPTSIANAPAPRANHTAVWTGDRMVVWGGDFLDSGGRYDPLGDTWMA